MPCGNRNVSDQHGDSRIRSDLVGDYMMTEVKAVALMTFERFAILLGMLGLAFTAGANWHQINVLDQRVVTSAEHVSQFEANVNRDYQRKDVTAAQFDGLNDKLDAIWRELQALKSR